MTTARATRRDEQRAQTRQDLLDAAGRVFAERGYHAASVDLVAEAAGYTKGAVYSNFDSKEELFLALLDRRMDSRFELTEQVLFGRPAEERAGMLVGDEPAMDVLDQDWYLLETEFLLYAARNEQVRERIAQRLRTMRERLTRLLRRHLDELGVTEEQLPAAEYTSILLALSDGLTRAALADPGAQQDAGQVLADVTDALLHRARARTGEDA